MNQRRFLKRGRVLALLVMCLSLILTVFAVNPAEAAVTYPNSMASLGDSITRAFNTGFLPFFDAPANNWSTGTNSNVNSHYERILATNPNIRGRNFNFAVSGAKMINLNDEVNSINQQVDYVTILLGANDVCTTNQANMTSVATFKSQLQTGLNTLKAKLPNARIFIASIPNIYNLWQILKDNFFARLTWGALSICQSMLVNPTSNATADVNRRNLVHQRNIDLNTALAEVCATYSRCRFDNNASYNTVFVPSDVSSRDYFHPTIAGQKKIADTTYPFALSAWQAAA
jgi:lysophospholipase L1-like esterase